MRALLGHRQKTFWIRVSVVGALSLASATFAPSSGSGYDSQDKPIGNGEPSAAALRQVVTDANWKPRDVALDWRALRRFYASRGYALAWSSPDESARALQALIHSDREGLTPADYKGSEITRPSGDNAIAQAHFDLLLTNSVLQYAQDLRQGRISAEKAYGDASLPRQRYDAIGDLNAAIANNSFADFLAGLSPPSDGYRALRSQLQRYREIVADGGWQRLPANASLNNRHMRRLLGERLAIEDDTVDAHENKLDPIREALIRFQSHHGLRSSGELDAPTLQALKIDAATRAEQIALNMERWRWLPREFGQRYVEVNVPSASLKVIDQGQAVLNSRVIVGRETDPTPLLQADATSLIVNPSWEIPSKIARKEILPKLRKHPSYLETHHIVSVSGGPNLRLRQLPGADNALGSIKIDMPNRFNVYLHDTPGQAAFASAQRSESHGCVRVEQILPLASYALSGTTDQAAPDLQDAVAYGDTQKIALPSPLPVYLVYWTVTAGEDGTVQFWPDVYGRDSRLHDALKNQVVSSRFSML